MRHLPLYWAGISSQGISKLAFVPETWVGSREWHQQHSEILLTSKWTHLQQKYTYHCTRVQSHHADISDLSRSIGNKTYYGEVTGKEKKNSTDDKERHKKPPSPTEGRWVLCIWLCSGKWCTLLPSLSWLPWHAHPWIYRKEQLNWMLSALPGVIPILQAMKNFLTLFKFQDAPGCTPGGINSCYFLNNRKEN